MGSIQDFIREASAPNFDTKAYLANATDKSTEDKELLKPTYTVETIGKVQRIALEIIKGIASVLFIPYGIYRLLHLIGSYFIVPAQHKKEHAFYREKLFEALRGEVVYKGNDEIFPGIVEAQKSGAGLIAKRIRVMVDGESIDAMIFGKKENLANRRWTLVSSGNATEIEEGLGCHSKDFLEKIDRLQTNILLYNYQGVGESQGSTTRDGMVNAHNAMLRFLEDDKAGIGAKEIVEFGFSIGGGVQGHAALVRSDRSPNVKRVCVKFETFSKVTKVPRSLILRFLMKISGWEFHTKKSSKKLEKIEIPEIVLQRAEELDGITASKILHDLVISAEASLAYGLLRKGKQWTYKKFIGVEGIHCSGYTSREEEALTKAVMTALSPDFKGFAAS